MSGRKGMQHCAVETKREAVRLVEEERQTYAALAAKPGIRKAKRIEVWVRMYRKEGEVSFHEPIGRPITAIPMCSTAKEAEQLIREYIYFYNYERIQLKTRQTPFEIRRLSL
jgi:transposase-like protein